MRYFLFTLLVVFSPLLLCAQSPTQSSTTKIYNEEGKLQMTIAYNPSCSCRIYTEYYTDGKVFARRTFKVEGRKEFIDGEDVDYYHDGRIKRFKLWENALPVGRAYEIHPNGKLAYEEFYEDSYKTGTWKYYDSIGQLYLEKIFSPKKTAWSNDKDVATYKYYKAGKLIRTENRAGKVISTSTTNGQSAQKIDLHDGKILFEKRCAACHKYEEDSYGPALKGVATKRNKDWLYRMIHNGQQLVSEGDPIAVALFQQWKKREHPSQERLDRHQIEAIIKYLKERDNPPKSKSGKPKK